MSREIKFRAWHKCEKKMLNLTKINFLSGAAWSDPESKPHIMCHENPECCILMQFTGLHDKNGKEIYEGDRVRRKTVFVNGASCGHIYKTVKWNSKRCSFNIRERIKICNGNWEVIGNIYDNPELLKQ